MPVNVQVGRDGRQNCSSAVVALVSVNVQDVGILLDQATDAVAEVARLRRL